MSTPLLPFLFDLFRLFLHLHLTVNSRERVIHRLWLLRFLLWYDRRKLFLFLFVQIRSNVLIIQVSMIEFFSSRNYCIFLELFTVWENTYGIRVAVSLITIALKSLRISKCV